MGTLRPKYLLYGYMEPLGQRAESTLQDLGFIGFKV